MLLIPTSDSGMSLFRVEMRGSEIIGQINKDHPVTHRALTRPIDRQYLNLGITQELASAIADDSKLLRKWFRPKIVTHLEEKLEPDRRRNVHRLLMDRIRQNAA